MSSRILVVVNNPANWPFNIPGVPVVAARTYLTDPRLAAARGTKVFNLCRSYRYQQQGYYVSLLAEARGHRPLPSLETIQELRSPSLVRSISIDLEDLVHRTLARTRGTEYEVNIYFGRNRANRHTSLCQQLFNLFPAPLLCASFAKDEDGWELRSLTPLSASEVPDSHRPFIAEAALNYFSRRSRAPTRRAVARYDLAILFDPENEDAPSNERAIDRFERAADRLRIRTERITKDDIDRLSEFDALFIRETTLVNHHTYRFSQRAKALGLVVIDDPTSILRCTNKVFLAELLKRNKIPTPKSMVVYRDNIDDLAKTLGLPLVLKEPDGAFSQGVAKVSDLESLRREAERMLESSDLILAQSFMPTEFDWRVGVLDGRPLFACRYHMAPNDWRVIGRGPRGGETWGETDTIPVEKAPPAVVETAVRATQLIGNGLYGVDLKELGGRAYVIEVNDNPNLCWGYEDRVLKDELYLRVMRVFLDRMERRSAGGLTV